MVQSKGSSNSHFNWAIILDFLLFPVFLILFSIPLCFWFSYHRAVKFLARIFHPDYIPLTGSDPLFSLDTFTKGSGDESFPEVRQNIGWLIRAQVSPGDNNINLEWIRDKFTSSFLKTEESSGRREYPNFFTYPVRYGGYTFRKPVEFIQIHHHIYECELRRGESLEEFTSRWLSKPFQESSPVWEVGLIRETGTAEETVIIFKINHSCADGYNLIHILDTLTDNQSPYLVKDFQETFWDKVKLLVQFPRLYTQFTLKGFAIGRTPAFPDLPKDKNFVDVMTFIDLDLSRLLAIRRKTETHFVSVIASIMGGVIEKICLDQAAAHDTKMPDCVQQFTSLPWPNHPRKEMCNHWTLGSLAVPLKCANPLERLRAVEKDFEDYHQRGLNKSSKRFLFKIFGILPSSVLKYVFEQNPGQTGFTALLGSSRDYQLNGNPIRLIHPLIGTSFENIGLSGFCFSHSPHFNCTLIAKTPIAELALGMNRIQDYFLQEVECLQKLLLLEEKDP